MFSPFEITSLILTVILIITVVIIGFMMYNGFYYLKGHTKGSLDLLWSLNNAITPVSQLIMAPARTGPTGGN